MKLIFLGRIAQAIVAFAALRIITTLLTPDEMGRWAILMATISFFVLGFVNPVGMFINRRLHTWIENGTIRKYMQYYAGYLILLAMMASIALAILGGFHEVIPGMPIAWVITLVGISIVFSTLNQTFIPSLNLIGHRGWFVILTLATLLLGLLASVIFVTQLSAKAESWQFGQLVGQVIVAGVAWSIFFSMIKRTNATATTSSYLITRQKMTTIFAFSWPLSIAVLLTWVQTQSYRFMVQESIGLEELGMFAVGYGISASLIGIFESIVSTYFLPGFYKQTSSNNRQQQLAAWQDYAEAMLPALILTVAVIVSMAQELTDVLLDAKFHAASQYIIWGALAEMMRVFIATYALVAHAHMNTRALVIPNLIGAVAAPAFVFSFVPHMGGDGVGLALMLAGLLVLLASKYIFVRKFAIRTPWKSLVTALLVSLLLVLLLSTIHTVFEYDPSLYTSLAWLMASGVILLGLLFLFLRPHLRKGDLL